MAILNESVKYGRLQLHNRLVMAPADTEKSNRGTVTPELLEHYDARTRGGCFGLVIIEHSFIREDGRANPNQLSVASDADIPGLTQLAEVIHKNGGKTVMQLNHAGAQVRLDQAVPDVISPSGLRSPRAVPADPSMNPPRALRREEIPALVDAYRDAALRAKAAGFDGVEIHSAHGYLLNQFYSPLTNHREDEYGCACMENRLRLHLQVIEVVRAACGPDFLVGIRLGACDYMDGGSTLEDAVAAAKILNTADLDFIDVTGGLCGYVRPDHKEAGYFGDASSAIRELVSFPVILAGGVRDRAGADRILDSELADFVSICRSVFKDPDFARNLLLEGKK